MTEETTDQQVSENTIIEPFVKDALSVDSIEDHQKELVDDNSIEENVFKDIKNDKKDVLSNWARLKKKITVWVIATSGVVYAAILFIPNLSASLKTLGLPYDLPKIKEEFSPTKPAPQISVLITPEIENNEFDTSEVILSLSNEAKQKNCTAEKDNNSPAFNIACDGEIGDKIHFILSSAGCTDKEEKAQLGYPKKSYIKCP